MKTEPRPLAFVGLNPSGDWGPLTFYTSKRRKVVKYIKAPPTCPPTNAQRTNRNRFRLAAGAWRSLDPAQRAAWEEATQLAKLPLTGYNLFTWWILTPDVDLLATISRQSGIQLPPQP